MKAGMKNKIALVTGGGSGIGRATALSFARNGAKVIIADINIGGGQETIHRIQQANGQATFIKVDVSKASEVEMLFDEIISTHKRLDFAFNNAGIIGGRATFTETSEEQWDRIININLRSVWLCMKCEIIQMTRQGGGAIVNASSLLGLKGSPTVPIYSVSKHGIIGLTRSAALGYAKVGIRVNAICPGAVITPLYRDNLSLGDEQFEFKAASQVPIGRLGNPDDVASAVIWLCSNEASYITGHALVIDGGWLA